MLHMLGWQRRYLWDAGDYWDNLALSYGWENSVYIIIVLD